MFTSQVSLKGGIPGRGLDDGELQFFFELIGLSNSVIFRFTVNDDDLKIFICLLSEVF